MLCQWWLQSTTIDGVFCSKMVKKVVKLLWRTLKIIVILKHLQPVHWWQSQCMWRINCVLFELSFIEINLDKLRPTKQLEKWKQNSKTAWTFWPKALYKTRKQIPGDRDKNIEPVWRMIKQWPLLKSLLTYVNNRSSIIYIASVTRAAFKSTSNTLCIQRPGINALCSALQGSD